MKIRAVGDIILDLEPLIYELVETHDLQFGDVLNLIHGYMMLHIPEAREEYINGDYPMFFYGHKDDFKA